MQGLFSGIISFGMQGLRFSGEDIAVEGEALGLASVEQPGIAVVGAALGLASVEKPDIAVVGAALGLASVEQRGSVNPAREGVMDPQTNGH